jgi:hypothetical protein
MGMFSAPQLKPTPAAPAVPDLSEEAIRNAKLMERRRQLGLSGRGSTWLTGARGDTAPPDVGVKTLLGS